MTIGFGDISQNTVLDDLVRHSVVLVSSSIFFSLFATFASEDGGGGRCSHKHLLKLSVVEI